MPSGSLSGVTSRMCDRFHLTQEQHHGHDHPVADTDGEIEHHG
jgi:hypothetical protein